MPNPAQTNPAFSAQQLREWMTLALNEAQQATEHGDVPVGAVVIDAHGTLIAQAHNQREADHNPCGHAEMLAIQAAARYTGQWRLPACTLVVTLEPCLMCASALVQAKLGAVVFGASDAQQGGLGGRLDVRTLTPGANTHTTQVVSGIMESECQQQLSDFFQRLRATE